MNGYLQEGLGSVNVKWTSIDGVDSISLSLESNKFDHPDIGEGATFTSNSSLSFLMNVPMLSSQDSYVDDHAGQANQPKSETSWMRSIQLLQMYAETLNPETVQTAATNPVSGPLRELIAETTDNENQSGFEQTIDEIKPTEKDVLFGRGGLSNNHPGNQRYLAKRLELQPSYKKAKRADKTLISKAFVNAVKAGGARFLKQEEGTSDRWYVVSDKEARRKASQALRDDRKRKASEKGSQALPKCKTPEHQATKRAKGTVLTQMK